MKLLAIETATDACSVALYQDGQLSEEFRLAPRAHTQLVLPMAEALLAEAGWTPGELDALAFGRGPGAFTGVRIATAVIQGMAYALDLPVVPVSTLAALAQGVHREQGWQRIACAMDARMNEVYWGCYERNTDGLMVLRDEERVCAAQDTPLLDGQDWYGCGSGWQEYAEPMSGRHPGVLATQAECWPHAQDIARLAVAALARGEGLPAEQALPVYLRDQVVQKPGG